MMKRLFLVCFHTFCLVIFSLVASGQGSAMELTFTAVNNTTHVQMDSIKVMNRTQGGDTVLYWPDTVLSFYLTDIPEPEQPSPGFRVYQNYPNPVADQTTISLYIPEKDRVTIIVTDLLGRKILITDKVLDRGSHSFRFSPGSSKLYFYTAQWKGRSSSIKILHPFPGSHNPCSLEYTGNEGSPLQFKVVEDTQSFAFSPGDSLLYIGYTDTLQSGQLDNPDESKTYTFQFAVNIPCPATPTVEYEGHVYKTIQIFSQCWLEENLDAGRMIPGFQDQTDNGIIEKYCYDNDPDSCRKYGGLYQWDEIMQYVTQQGAKGICPSGWHLPADEEWKVLEGAVDGTYFIGDPEWDTTSYRGSDAGTNLKSTTGWLENDNGTDLFGFAGMPAGFRFGDATFHNVSRDAYWWSSTDTEEHWNAWMHRFHFHSSAVYRDYFVWSKVDGFSVRCLRDRGYMKPIVLTFSALDNTAHIQTDSIRVMNRTRGEETMLFWPDTSFILQSKLDFYTGDELLCIGYSGSLESGFVDSPENDESYTIQFAVNIPCPGTPIVEYEGQVYNTIQILGQCWLKENLNAGIMLPGTQDQSDNGIIEKYCYNNEPDSCAKFGGLYQWDEMMQYTTHQGVRGICPPGWHIPTDEDWKVLEGAVDSQYGIGDPEWDISYTYRGFDAGLNLKSRSEWYYEGNGTDQFGFTLLPAGAYDRSIESFYQVGILTSCWSSTEMSDFDGGWLRSLYNSESTVLRDFNGKPEGYSLRCVREN